MTDSFYLKETSETVIEDQTMDMHLTGTDFVILQDQSLSPSAHYQQEHSLQTLPSRAPNYRASGDAFVSSSDAHATCQSLQNTFDMPKFTAEQCQKYFTAEGDLGTAVNDNQITNIEESDIESEEFSGHDVDVTLTVQNSSREYTEYGQFDQKLEEQVRSFLVDNSTSRIELDEFLNQLKNNQSILNDLSSIHDSTFIQKDREVCQDPHQLAGVTNLLQGIPIEKSPAHASFNLEIDHIEALRNKITTENHQIQDLKQFQEVYERILLFYSQFGINTHNNTLQKQNQQNFVGTRNHVNNIGAPKSLPSQQGLNGRRGTKIGFQSYSPLKYRTQKKLKKSSSIFSPNKFQIKIHQQVGACEKQPNQHYLNSDFMRKVRMGQNYGKE